MTCKNFTSRTKRYYERTFKKNNIEINNNYKIIKKMNNTNKILIDCNNSLTKTNDVLYDVNNKLINHNNYLHRYFRNYVQNVNVELSNIYKDIYNIYTFCLNIYQSSNQTSTNETTVEQNESIAESKEVSNEVSEDLPNLPLEQVYSKNFNDDLCTSI